MYRVVTWDLSKSLVELINISLDNVLIVGSIFNHTERNIDFYEFISPSNCDLCIIDCNNNFLSALARIQFILERKVNVIYINSNSPIERKLQENLDNISNENGVYITGIENIDMFFNKLIIKLLLGNINFNKIKYHKINYLCTFNKEQIVNFIDINNVLKINLSDIKSFIINEIEGNIKNESLTKELKYKFLYKLSKYIDLFDEVGKCYLESNYIETIDGKMIEIVNEYRAIGTSDILVLSIDDFEIVRLKCHNIDEEHSLVGLFDLFLILFDNNIGYIDIHNKLLK